MARAGEFRDQITIEMQDESGNDGAGNVQTAWVKRLGPVPGRIAPLRARELIHANGVSPLGVYEVTLRYDPAAMAATIRDRIVDQDGVTYSIAAPPINPDGRRRVVKLTAERGRGDGG